MSTVERLQSPTVGNTINLRLFTYNSNNRRDVQEVEQVEIYFLDPNERTEENPDGRTLVETIAAEAVEHVETGQYLVSLFAESPTYVIGRYIDVWTVLIEGADASTITNKFEILPSLWYTNVSPIVYDFSFRFQPNKLRKGSKRYLIIDVLPNVPSGSDLERYYTNLAIASPLSISIEKACVECLPIEEDLRLVVDKDSVDFREKCKAFYMIDTEDWDVGIYNVWFTMTFGENVYISDRQQLQIF